MSTEDRREAKREARIRFLQANPQIFSAPEIRGKVAIGQDGRVKLVDESRSLIRHPDRVVPEEHAFRTTEVRKRTLEERVASMVARLRSTPPELQEALIQQIAGEYWKAGMPVSGEDLRKLAAHYLDKADKNPIRVTRKESTNGGHRTPH